ncbi:type II toxin-antitoxin system Phd/YefM family antitoxin [uncultured Porticoccus sp.]|uniref:type II toxin-antitoxin system Phd/YefM family antitoxin n=1 Tax=uncultured Porticoccus sp. TaxID=1256050 RepID=UPI002633A459|nr:type II toxin-antitoxin system Phd/YefM family antitoxin [uncultured Porticoccus sp.]
MTAWQLQDAKNRFSALVKAAESEGPQVVTVHGKDKAVLLSVEAYQQLIQRKGSLLDFFQSSPWAKTDIEISRSRDTGREIEL